MSKMSILGIEQIFPSYDKYVREFEQKFYQNYYYA